MATFYTGVDKSIYQGGDHYVPMDKFRLNPYEPKNLSYTSTGITGAEAAGPYRRYPQGGGDDQEWNAVKPVYENYWQGANFPGAQKAPGMGKDFIGPSFSPNFQSQFDQRYADHMRTVENPDAYNRDADGNLTTRKDVLQRSMIAENWDQKYVPKPLRIAASFIPFGNAGLNWIEKRMNDKSRGIGSYGIAGMDASQKGMYDTLASQGLLYNTGNTGFKTATGKNFNAKGYAEGQAKIWEKHYAHLTDKEIIKELEDKNKNWRDTYIGKRYLEAKAAKFQKDKEIIHGGGDSKGGGKKTDGTDGTDGGSFKTGDENYGFDDDSGDFTGEGFGSDSTGNESTAADSGGWGDDYASEMIAEGGRVGLRYGGLLSIL